MTSTVQLRRALPLVLVCSLAGAGAVRATTESEPSGDSSEPPGSSADVAELDIPGGVRPQSLEEGTWFNDEGRLRNPQSSGVSDEKHAAFCDFLFGTTDEIAAVFGLDSVYMVDGSGFVVMGGGGTGYRCGYSMDEESTESAPPTSAANTAPGSTTDDRSNSDDEQPLIYFTIWSTALEIDAEDRENWREIFVLDVGGADEAVLLALSNEFDGEMIDAEFADAWLSAARSRQVS